MFKLLLPLDSTRMTLGAGDWEETVKQGRARNLLYSIELGAASSQINALQTRARSPKSASTSVKSPQREKLTV